MVSSRHLEKTETQKNGIVTIITITCLVCSFFNRVHSTVSLLRSHMLRMGYGDKVICLETLIIHNLYFQISAIPFKYIYFEK